MLTGAAGGGCSTYAVAALRLPLFRVYDASCCSTEVPPFDVVVFVATVALNELFGLLDGPKDATYTCVIVVKVCDDVHVMLDSTTGFSQHFLFDESSQLPDRDLSGYHVEYITSA